MTGSPRSGELRRQILRVSLPSAPRSLPCRHWRFRSPGFVQFSTRRIRGAGCGFFQRFSADAGAA